MVREIDNPSAPRMPPAGSPQATDPGEIGMVGNPPELHLSGSGENSVIDLLEHFADDGCAEFILEEVCRPLARQGPIRPLQPSFSFIFVTKDTVSERFDLKSSNHIRGLVRLTDLVRRRVKFPNELSEAFRNSSPDDIIIHGSDLVPDPGLNLRIQPTFAAKLFQPFVSVSERLGTHEFISVNQ
jgi:hypothetical protein